ncbi:hypothetical protein OF83DRAFT_1082682 [Amylostereum chailletii]|nr:hypothetical protein OF83DRAFT_1082682 [Amylostereum chailletii]
MPCMRGEDPACFAFLERHLRVCKAVVIDVDAVVYGGLIRGCSAYHHDPTVLKFMSRRGLSARDVSGQYGLTHSVLDDVEGVLWIVMWKIVTHADREWREMGWYETLSSDSVSTVNHTKQAIVSWFSERDFVRKGKKKVTVLARPLLFWDSIYDIVKEWMKIAKVARLDMEVIESYDNEDLDEETREVTFEYLVRYLKAGVEFLEKSGQYRDGTE